MNSKRSKRTGRYVRRTRPIKRRVKKKATRRSVARVLRRLVPNL